MDVLRRAKEPEEVMAMLELPLPGQGKVLAATPFTEQQEADGFMALYAQVNGGTPSQQV